jgi:hypothetical protein
MIQIMKSFYILAVALGILLFVNDASAQYVAVRSGNWSVTAGPNTPWDPSGRPPSNCNNCTITINSNVSVILDAHVTLTGTSDLKIGSDGTGPAKLIIGASGGTDFASSFNLILSSAGTDNTNLRLLFANTTVDATAAGMRDGVFTQNGSYSKQVGNRPGTVFNPDGSLSSDFPVQGGNLLTGPSNLSGAGPLPIILMAFTATSEKGNVDLKWTSAQESNSDFFAIERLDPANSTWESIGRVTAQGNSSHEVQYSFNDESPRSGINEYRLRLVDRDGRYTYSEVKAVTLGAFDAKIFPNPASDYAYVSLSSAAVGTQSVRLFSQSGQLLIEKKVDNAAGTIVSLPVSNYPQGNYLIIVTGANGSRQVSKLFISRL